MSRLRCAGHILAKAPCVEELRLPGPLVQFIRGIKPRWLPKSKSKIFYVRTPTPINEEEHEKLRTMYFHHRIKMRAVRRFLTELQAEKAAVQKKLVADSLVTTADFQSMEEKVNQWNSQVQEARLEGLAKVKEQLEERTRRWEERVERRKQERVQRAEKRLRVDLEDSKSFITQDNLDTEIEKLLNLRRDYNFAVDHQGNKISDDLTQQMDSVSLADTSDQKDSVK